MPSLNRLCRRQTALAALSDRRQRAFKTKSNLLLPTCDLFRRLWLAKPCLPFGSQTYLYEIRWWWLNAGNVQTPAMIGTLVWTYSTARLFANDCGQSLLCIAATSHDISIYTGGENGDAFTSLTFCMTRGYARLTFGLLHDLIIPPSHLWSFALTDYSPVPSLAFCVTWQFTQSISDF